MIRDLFKQTSSSISEELKQFGITLYLTNDHVVDRAIDRSIDIQFIASALRNFKTNHICEFVYLASFPEDIRPWRMELRGNEGVIIVLSRYDDKKWKFNTLLDPAIHSLHDDEKPGTFHNRIMI